LNVHRLALILALVLGAALLAYNVVHVIGDNGGLPGKAPVRGGPGLIDGPNRSTG
jgi:hypothetical protein